MITRPRNLHVDFTDVVFEEQSLLTVQKGITYRRTIETKWRCETKVEKLEQQNC